MSRETKFSGTYGDGRIFIFPVQLATSRIGNPTRLIHTLLYAMAIYILPSRGTRLYMYIYILSIYIYSYTLPSRGKRLLRAVENLSEGIWRKVVDAAQLLHFLRGDRTRLLHLTVETRQGNNRTSRE